MKKFTLRTYTPHEGQKAFHYAMEQPEYRFCAMIAGIRGGKTFAGAREAVRQAWNAKGKGVYGIIAPTFNMLDRTTWVEFKEAARPLMLSENDSKKIITLKNGRKVHGHSAEKPDRIRNESFIGFWCDEAREAKNFKQLWDVLLGRVLSTGGKGFITTSPNSFDDIHDIFIATKKEGYGVVRFPTYVNINLSKEGIDQLVAMYDAKFAQQEIYGEFVIFEGAVYYTFNRQQNAGDLAFKVAQYDPDKPLWTCADFNIDPMAWVICQPGISEETKLKEVYVIDEIYIKNCNTQMACQEFKTRYPNHKAGIVLYGDASGKWRHTSSHITDWKIIENELSQYGLTNRVPNRDPAERDRINAVNGLICNSRNQRRVFVNPKNCPRLIRDFEQVAFKKGSTQIDKTSNFDLTHSSDAFGYMAESEFSLNRGRIEGLKI